VLGVKPDSPGKRQAIGTGAARATLYRVSAALQKHSATIKAYRKTEVRKKFRFAFITIYISTLVAFSRSK